MCYHISCFFTLMLILIQWSAAVSGSHYRVNEFKDAQGDAAFRVDLREIQRQNQITTQILQNYLEKRLYGHHRSSKPPSVWEILPRTRRKPVNNIQEAINGTTSREKETLEETESERINAYEDYEEFDEENEEPQRLLRGT